MRDRFDPGFPLFFKLWFGFVAGLAVLMIASVVYVTAQVVSAGPEGWGRVIGTILKSVEEGRR